MAAAAVVTAAAPVAAVEAEKDKYVSKSPQEIESAVEDALIYDPQVDLSKLSVEVQAGIATLRGTVDDLNEKRAAAGLARNVVGVWSVTNRIKVRPEAPPSDARIEDNIEAALIRDPYVERYKIDVSVADGEAYLDGGVVSNFERARADNLAARQRGVVVVHNFINVLKPSESAYEPYAENWYLYDYDWYGSYDTSPPAARGSDWKIEKDIRDRIFWSPYVEGEDVNVEVEDGAAILTGTVDTWNERQAAERNAWKAGAASVDNNLTVNYGPEYYKQ